jgi:hypothetical protein
MLVIFRDKPLSVIYFDSCLINPPVFPGAIDTIDYLEQLHFKALGGDKSAEEISEIVGEIWGRICTQTVIAISIIGFLSESASIYEKRSLEKSFEKLIKKQKKLIVLTRSVGILENKTIKIQGQDIELPQLKLDMKIVSEFAAKSSQFLLSARDPDVILEYERTVGENIRSVRINSINNFAPSRLRDNLYDGIEELTGFRPQ